jgi:hypothetical protein
VDGARVIAQYDTKDVDEFEFIATLCNVRVEHTEVV